MGGKFEWPTMKDVVEYRRQVRQQILKIIDDTPLILPITKDTPWVIINEMEINSFGLYAHRR